jgi:hypothetical protein
MLCPVATQNAGRALPCKQFENIGASPDVTPRPSPGVGIDKWPAGRLASRMAAKRPPVYFSRRRTGVFHSTTFDRKTGWYLFEPGPQRGAPLRGAPRLCMAASPRRRCRSECWSGRLCSERAKSYLCKSPPAARPG